MIKKAARQLLSEDLEFREDFDYNKKLLKDKLPSKPIRNKVAGYISRLVKIQKRA